MNAIYPDNTTGVYSYIESRGGKYDKTVFFGLQAYIKEYLLKPITQEDIDLADEVWTAHGEPFNRVQWQYILDKHNGYLPVRIKAVPEGLVIPNKNVLVTIENTDPECYWLTTWLETSMLRAVWYPTTVCTLSWHIKQTIKSYLEKTGDVAGLDFKCADFGARGVSSHESAGIGAMAHLVNFKGTDTIAGVMYARKFYDCPMAGYSVVASEHSISTSFGGNKVQKIITITGFQRVYDFLTSNKFTPTEQSWIIRAFKSVANIDIDFNNINKDTLQNEINNRFQSVKELCDGIRGFLDGIEKTPIKHDTPNKTDNEYVLWGLVGIYRDYPEYQYKPITVGKNTYNISIYDVNEEADYVLKMLKTYGDGRIVSIVGDTYDIYYFCKMLYENEEIKQLIVENSKKGGVVVVRPDSGIPSEVVSKCLEILNTGFGSIKNEKGYKVLNHVRIIQGDGINEVSIKEILETITILGFSADNIVFGMGGQLLGAPQRDDLKFAMKASAVCIDGVWKDIFKDPITDKGKTSKKGRVTLYKDENGYYSDVENPDKESVLQTVFENGKLYNEITFDQVRINSQQ